MIQQSVSQSPPSRLTGIAMPHVYSSAVVSDLAGFAALADEWQALMRKAGLENVTLDHQWLTTWLKYFPPQKLMIVTVRNEKGELCGAAPLMINRTKAGLFQRILRRVQVIGTDPCVYDRFEIAVLPGVPEDLILQEVARQLIDARSKWDMLDFRFNTRRSQWDALAEKLAKHTFVRRVEETMPIPYLNLPKTEAELSRKKRLKQDLRYVKNRLQKEENETFRLEYQVPSAETTALFNLFFERHIAYWKARGFRSDFLRYPALKDFYKDVFVDFQPGASRLGDVRFSLVKFGETPISYQIGFAHRDNYLAHLTNYHQEYKKYLPGILHMDMLVVDALEHGRESFEFGRGDEEYKKQWTEEKKALWNLSLYQTPWSVISWKLDQMIKQLVRKIAEAL